MLTRRQRISLGITFAVIGIVSLSLGLVFSKSKKNENEPMTQQISGFPDDIDQASTGLTMYPRTTLTPTVPSSASLAPSFRPTSTPSTSTPSTSTPSFRPSLEPSLRDSSGAPSENPNDNIFNNEEASLSASPSDLSTMAPSQSAASSLNPSSPPTNDPASTPNPTGNTSGPSSLPSLAPSVRLSPQPTTVTSAPSPISTPSLSPTKLSRLDPTEPPSATSSPSNTELPWLEESATRFYAIGDVPYTTGEARELEWQIQSLAADAEFLIHVGDIRSARDGLSCEEEEYTAVANILNQSKVPVFLVLGDNEWNDCPNVNQGFVHWMKVFGSFESNWNHDFDIIRPTNRTENFAFVHKKSLFIGLNLVGGGLHHAGEWRTRLQDQFEWVKELVTSDVLGSPSKARGVIIFGHANPASDHSGFFDPLSSYIRDDLNNSIPFLYLNGDAHAWRVDTDFYGQSNFLRMQVEGGTRDPPLQVTVNATADSTVNATADRSNASAVFSYNRMLEMQI